jgi:uncharacterized CHY-type Zn-finger protein
VSHLSTYTSLILLTVNQCTVYYVCYRNKRTLTNKDSQQRPTVVYAINPVTTTEFDFDFSGDYDDISNL